MPENYSVRDLRLLAKGKVQREISLELFLYDSYENFVGLVNRSLDHIIQRMSQNPELRQGLTEDQLTIEIVNGLHYMGFLARHETKVGGHCDIVVEGDNDYLWLGEAKVFKGKYSWLLKGFRQLNTRYATANPGQDAGGLIIYSFKPRIDRVISTWGKRLAEICGDISVTACPRNPPAVLSKHTHHRTGRLFTTRHLPVSLYWNPQDRDED
jgi:hypothetical protein